MASRQQTTALFAVRHDATVMEAASRPPGRAPLRSRNLAHHDRTSVIGPLATWYVIQVRFPVRFVTATPEHVRGSRL